MSFTLGVFDLFAYAIPGALYLAIAAYLAHRGGLVDVTPMIESPGVFLLVGLALLSYIVGHATYPLARGIEQLLYRVTKIGPADTARKFQERHQLLNQPFLAIDVHLLKAVVEVASKDAAGEIHRLRAQSLMLRNSTIPLAIATAVALVEIFTNDRRLAAGAAGAILLLLTIGCVQKGRILQRWAQFKTFELAYWIKELHQAFAIS